MDTGLSGKAKRVRIYLSEGRTHGHKPVTAAVLALLRKERAAGATVIRAVEGFGASGVLHTFRFAEMAWHLPILVEWIDRPEVVERLLPPIKEMVKHGLITVDEVSVELYSPTPVRDLSPVLHVADVMSKEVVSVGPDAPLREVVQRMLDKPYRAIPVLAAGAPVGIITNTDLIRRGGLVMRMQLLEELAGPELGAELERLGQETKNAASVMSTELVTISPDAPLTRAAELMAFRRLKRLPVVDEQGTLVGMVSRLDVLRTAIRTFEGTEGDPPDLGLAVNLPVSRIMRTDVPVVFPESHISDILQAVTSTRLNRCLVIDHEKHVLGKITDAEVLERVTPGLRPSALRSLAHRLPFVHPRPDELATELHAKARTAADLMVGTAIVAENAPLRAAIAAMLAGEHKIVAVVDESQGLQGVLDRADLLHGLVNASGTAR